MKKVFIGIFLLFVCFVNIGYSPVFAEATKVIIIVNSCSIYENADTTSNVIGSVPHNEILDVIEKTGIATVFYKVTYNDITGYILSTHIIDADFVSPEKFIDFNAETNKDTFAYTLFEENFVITENELVSGQKVRLLEKFDKKKEYLQISFYDSNKNIVVDYIKTEDIKVYGINKTVIVAISLIVTSSIIILLLFGFKSKAKTKVIDAVKNQLSKSSRNKLKSPTLKE